MKSNAITCRLIVAVGLAGILAIQLGCKREAATTAKKEATKVAPKTPATSENVVIPPNPATKTKAAAKPTRPEFVNATFEPPFRLMVKNEPLNTAAKQMYPSPAIYDVDNDGQNELIVGDIFGSLNVYENMNSDGGDPIWSSHYALTTADGKAIKVSNW